MKMGPSFCSRLYRQEVGFQSCSPRAGRAPRARHLLSGAAAPGGARRAGPPRPRHPPLPCGVRLDVKQRFFPFGRVLPFKAFFLKGKVLTGSARGPSPLCSPPGVGGSPGPPLAGAGHTVRPPSWAGFPGRALCSPHLRRQPDQGRPGRTPPALDPAWTAPSGPRPLCPVFPRTPCRCP